MGLLDQLAGQVLGSVMGNQSGGGSNQLIEIAQSLIQQNGGISGLLEKFNVAGLGEQAASWVSTGANLPVDAGGIAQALGQSGLGELAAKFGLSHDQLSGGLAQVLPQLIDKVTPAGSTEGADDLLRQGLSMLGGAFGKS